MHFTSKNLSRYSIAVLCSEKILLSGHVLLILFISYQVSLNTKIQIVVQFSNTYLRVPNFLYSFLVVTLLLLLFSMKFLSINMVGPATLVDSSLNINDSAQHFFLSPLLLSNKILNLKAPIYRLCQSLDT